MQLKLHINSHDYKAFLTQILSLNKLSIPLCVAFLFSQVTTIMAFRSIALFACIIVLVQLVGADEGHDHNMAPAPAPAPMLHAPAPSGGISSSPAPVVVLVSLVASFVGVLGNKIWECYALYHFTRVFFVLIYLLYLRVFLLYNFFLCTVL